MEKVKISSLAIENVKKVQIVEIELSETGLTVIGGNNAEGKTTILDSICWALGGAKYEPSEVKRRDSSATPNIKLELSNGIIVERKGKNGDLKITGQTGGQNLLNSFVEELAINLPKFLESKTKDKVKTLLSIIGVEKELQEFDEQEQKFYNERLVIGRQADQKAKFAKECEFFPDMPEQVTSASELIQSQQDVLKVNLAIDEAIKNKEALCIEVQNLNTTYLKAEKDLIILKNKLDTAENKYHLACELPITEKQSTEQLEKNINDIDTLNAKIMKNLDKAKAEDEAQQLHTQYNDLSMQIETVRENRTNLLNNAKLPLPELTIVDNELSYKGAKWDCMSGAEQLIVATSIVRALKPECGFVLMDKLEQMDLDTLKSFGDWLVQEGLQVIGTRVSKGEECSIIIENGVNIKEVEEVKPAIKSVF